MGELHQLQLVLLLLLIFVAGFSLLAQRFSVPYPIVLVVAGLLISVVPGIPRVRLNPDMVFLIFLPPLLYASAWTTSWRDFKYELVSIALLAIGLVGFTVFGIAYFADHFITALDWKSGLVLGAVISTTDAIAATSIAKKLGLPKRIVDLLEGESLVNDATGLLALEFGLVLLLQGRAPSVGEGALRLLWLMCGGLGLGLAMGVLVAWFERFVDDGPVEIVISLVVPYLAYLAGEAIHASGVLAVVACGLYLGRKSSTIFSPRVRVQLSSVWEGMTFALNGLVFVLIGLQLPYVLMGIHGYGWKTLLLYGSVFSLLLIVLRLVWVYPGAWAAWWIRTHGLKQKYKRPGWREIFVEGWTGMRGVVALAAAISIPETLGDGRPFEQRSLIVFLTFSVILVTLVFQGLSLPPLIRALGLAGLGPGEKEENEARLISIEAGLKYLLDAREKSGDPDVHECDDAIHLYRHRLEAIKTGGKVGRDSFARWEEIQRAASDAERGALIRARDAGQIGDETLRKIEMELDLVDIRNSGGV